MHHHGQIPHKSNQIFIAILCKLLKVDIDTHKVILNALVDHTVDKSPSLGWIMEDTTDQVATEILIYVVSKHRHDGHTAFTHQRKPFVVNLYFQSIGFRVYKHPFPNPIQKALHKRDSLMLGMWSFL